MTSRYVQALLIGGEMGRISTIKRPKSLRFSIFASTACHCLFLVLTMFPAAIGLAETRGPDEEVDTLSPVGRTSGFLRQQRPTIASPADFQEAEFDNAGALSLESGYLLGLDRGQNPREQEIETVLRYAATRHHLLHAIQRAYKWERTDDGGIESGTGESRLGFQYLVAPSKNDSLALAVAYAVKPPSGSSEFSSDSFDHRITTLISGEFRGVETDVNLGYIAVEEDGESGWRSGFQGAVSVGTEATESVGLEVELSGQSVDEAEPKGVYLIGATTYKVWPRVSLDAGVRYTANGNAPRIAVLAGLTVGIRDFAPTH